MTPIPIFMKISAIEDGKRNTINGVVHTNPTTPTPLSVVKASIRVVATGSNFFLF